jgi:hypothetical protein
VRCMLFPGQKQCPPGLTHHHHHVTQSSHSINARAYYATLNMLTTLSSHICVASCIFTPALTTGSLCGDWYCPAHAQQMCLPFSVLTITLGTRHPPFMLFITAPGTCHSPNMFHQPRFQPRQIQQCITSTATTDRHSSRVANLLHAPNYAYLSAITAEFMLMRNLLFPGKDQPLLGSTTPLEFLSVVNLSGGTLNTWQW